MKKRLSQWVCALCALLPAGLQAADEASVQLQFELAGSDVTVRVVDETGNEMDGVTATLTSASHAFSAPKSAITANMLSPNVNFNTSPEVNMTFSIQGLPADFQFNTVGLDVHALNSTGAYQENSDNQLRQFNFAVSYGADAHALNSFATLNDVDIAAGVGEENNVHQVWDITSSTLCNATNPLVLSLTVTKGTTNKGCFMGLTSITLSQKEGDTPEPDDPADDTFPNPKAYYYLKGNGSNTQYMIETTDGKLRASAPNISEYQFWQFVPTGKENCFYIKNATTGHYVQSCSRGGSAQVVTGTTPVEYYIGQNGTKYRFTSTDCANYDDTSRSPFGLNKDGSSGNIVSYQAGPSNANSWWQLIETDYLYEVQPFSPSAALGFPDFLYSIRSTKGQALAMNEEGTLEWKEGQFSNDQAWYFVGTSNHDGGYLIVNKGTGLTVNQANEEQTRWAIFATADQSGYYFKPASAQDVYGNALAINGDSLMLFSAFRSDYARAAQIYELPCGALGNQYVTRAEISGESVLRSMVYPLPVYNNKLLTQPNASRPTSWYTLFTQDKATLCKGNAFTLTLQLNAAPLAGTEVYVYFDWDRDGVFEARETITAAQSMTGTFTVPGDAKDGKTRIRIRITENGLAGAEDDVIGQTLDFVANVSEGPTENYPLSITSCDELRGTVAWTSNEQQPAEITATATPAGDSDFLYWRDGNRIVSTENPYVFRHDHAVQLVAYFTPNTTVPVGIEEVSDATGKGDLSITAKSGYLYVDTNERLQNVTVYQSNGKAVLQSTAKRVSTASLQPGTYIVRALTVSNREGVAKIIIDSENK